MSFARRFLTGFRETETSQPGLELNEDGTVDLVNPDGSRTALAGGGGSQTFHGWALDYDQTLNSNQRQFLAQDATALDLIFNVEVIDTDGFHADANPHVTIPVGLGGMYDLRLVIVTGGDAGTEIGSRFAYFRRNGIAYDVVPGYWQQGQQDLIPADVVSQGMIAVFAELNEGDTLNVEAFCINYTHDILINFDPSFHQDTYFMGRYIGPLAT
jgi:hypothetical protein